MDIFIACLMRLVFVFGLLTSAILVCALVRLIYCGIRNFYYNNIHKDAYKVTFALRRSYVLNDDKHGKYVNIAHTIFERYVLAKDKYDAVAKTMRDNYEWHIVVLDVQKVSL